MKKLTRKAQLLMFVLVLAIFFGLGYILIQFGTQEKEEPTVSKEQYQISVVVENKKITSTYLDSISSTNASNTYKDYTIELKKGTKIDGYTLSNDQTFHKYLKLEAPDGKEVLTKKNNQIITHYAYSMLLTGDIIEKTNLSTKEKTYEITNARITYDQIPLVLLSNENSVSLRNKSKSKEKLVNLQDFINALKDTKKRETMISW